MKKLMFIFIFLAFILNASDELSWVDEQVNAIKPIRKGISYKQIAYLKNPFVFLEKNKTKKEDEKEKKEEPKEQNIQTTITNTTKVIDTKPKIVTKLKLSAIMNKSALINGKWYKVGERVGGYKITKITLKEVYLVGETSTKTLTTYTNLKQ